MAQERLTHRKKKESTAKWFIFSIIPVVNLYWLWKVAEIVSGHEKHVPERYQTLKHMSKKEPTGKWFAIFLVPVVLAVVAAVSLAGGTIADEDILALGAIGGILLVVAFLVGVYVLYKMAISVAGHETVYPEQYETVGHLEKTESTAKWFIFGIVPILNLYFDWKMSETISGHETIFE